MPKVAGLGAVGALLSHPHHRVLAVLAALVALVRAALPNRHQNLQAHLALLAAIATP